MIHVMGIDWTCASVEQREQVMVPEESCAQFLQEATALSGVEGCVLLQTCNRFELYLDAVDEQACCKLLPRIPQARMLSEERAERHVMEVAAGLRSQILGEDQIITQVRSALKSARAAQTTTSTLETLFRLAVTAGKAVRTKVKFCTVEPSTAKKAVHLAHEVLQGLEGKRAVVIGNGEIGRLAAQHLLDAGCSVDMTLRSYRSGNIVIPEGCTTVPYSDRLLAIEGSEVLVSATKSPHFTMTADMFSQLKSAPQVVIDLALPRDIEKPEPSHRRSKFFDIDNLRDERAEHLSPAYEQAGAIIDKHHEDFKKWQRGRELCRAESAKGIAVFAGTSEGRALCAHLGAHNVETVAFVATEYGSRLLREAGSVTVRTGRLDSAAMIEELGSFSTVVDATHPFATEVSKNIYAATQQVKTNYVRLVRPSTDKGSHTKSVPTMQQAAEFLAHTEGAVLLTIGTKELAAFTQIPNYAERLYARILPDVNSLQQAKDLGFLPSHLICMQGPFSGEMNVALMRSVKARWLVTKDTGDAGGFSQKIEAAEKLGVGTVVVARPAEPVAGFTLEEVCVALTGSAPQGSAEKARRFPLFVDLQNKQCLVVGGGKVGVRRAQALQDFGAQVLLVAPEVGQTFSGEGVRVERRRFAHGDTEGMALVVAATNSTAVNQLIAKECCDQGIPVNVSDNPELCDFFFPALCTSDHLVAGVVGDGENHALVVEAAAAIRATLGGVDL